MSAHVHVAAVNYDALDDNALAVMVQQGHREAFRHIMQRSNQRLFRIARSVVHDDTEAEDVVQESYMRAYDKLDTFRGDSKLLTWLTTIVLNEARGRLRKRHNMVGLEQIDLAPDDSHQVLQFPAKFGTEDPASNTARAQIRQLLENAIDELPAAFRIVYVMREIEDCTVEETATQLEILPETVKTRLFRARRLLRTSLQGTLAATMSDAFPFMGQRCARVTEAVMARLDAEFPPHAA